MITNMSVAGICAVLKVDLGSGEDPAINLGRKTRLLTPPQSKGRKVSCILHLTMLAEHQIQESFMR